MITHLPAHVKHKGEAELRRADKLNSSNLIKTRNSKTNQERKACRKNAALPKLSKRTHTPLKFN